MPSSLQAKLSLQVIQIATVCYPVNINNSQQFVRFAWFYYTNNESWHNKLFRFSNQIKKKVEAPCQYFIFYFEIEIFGEKEKF